MKTKGIIKTALIIVSIAGLALTIVPALLVFMQAISMDLNKQLMVIGMVLWFSTAPFWIKEQKL